MGLGGDFKPSSVQSGGYWEIGSAQLTSRLVKLQLPSHSTSSAYIYFQRHLIYKVHFLPVSPSFRLGLHLNFFIKLKETKKENQTILTKF